MSEHDTEPTPDGDDADQFAVMVVDELESLRAQINELRSTGTPTLWPTPAHDMAAWVDEWLVPTFDLGIEIRNWQQIPALVSELTALWVGYKAMTDPKAGGFDALVWHSHLASTRTRMQAHRKQHRSGNLRRTES